MRADVVDHGSGLDHARPADQAGHTERALPVRCLLALERGCAAVRPSEDLGPVVGRVDHDGVVGHAEIIDKLEKLPNVPVVLDHAVRIEAEASLAVRFLL